MLQITDLHASVEGKEILKGLNLEVKKGEVHAIMGPNGSGKTTLASILAGKEDYEVTKGSIQYLNEDLIEMAPEDRARKGIFLAFQYPVEIPGVSNINFLKMSVNELRAARGLEPLNAVSFLKLVKEKAKKVNISEAFFSRPLNVGFSGGEKKRNEVFQIAVLEPQLSILDETDSGLDIDALKVVAKGVNTLRNANNSMVLITHYQRLLNYIIPDRVHILYQGKIIQTGDKSLALELEEKGYDWIRQKF